MDIANIIHIISMLFSKEPAYGPFPVTERLRETIVTSKVLQSLNPGQRPFMLSRGTFAGMGRGK